MRLIDLSQPVYDDCPNCPAHPPVRITLEATHDKVGWQLEMFRFASHTGSHVDAPLHKLARGRSIDQIPLERFVGPAVIAELRDLGANGAISAEVLSKYLGGGGGAAVRDRVVLLATGWGDRRAKTREWEHESPFVDESGAAWLVEHQARGVGIDHYSISGSREPNNARVHEILLGGGVWIVEELHFGPEALALAGGGTVRPVTFWCLPIHLRGHSGAPCRPVLVIE